MSSAPDIISEAAYMGENPSGESWNPRSFSASCNSLLKEVYGQPDGADLLMVMGFLYRIHPEYGSVATKITGSKRPSNSGNFQVLLDWLERNRKILVLPRYTAGQWAELVLSVMRVPDEPPVLNGRLFLIASLLSHFPDVFSQVNEDKEWQHLSIDLIDKLEEELESNAKDSFYTLLTEKGSGLLEFLRNPEKVERSEWPEDSIIDTNNLSDGPAKEDSLSRKALAKYLAKRLRYIYNRDIDKGKFGSFFMHIDGAWGSGKSTLLGFLEEELKKNVQNEDQSKSKKLSGDKWIIVNFNAWENQRLDPPWWYLMKGVYNEAIRSLKYSVVQSTDPETIGKDKRIVRRLVKNELLWRLNTVNNYLVVAGLTLFLFIGSLVFGANTEKQFKALPIIELITLFGFIWSSVKVFGTSLASGSAKAAKNFIEENSRDPLQVIADHFKDQINLIGYPVAIFIDDLDRCNKDYGIKLLEGLQTIFKRAGVVYVIAADRKWLSTMYEHQYEIFAPVLQKPSKPFGMIFLDKIFQLIVELPDISSVQKKIYWDNLLNVGNKAETGQLEHQKSEIKKMVEQAGNNVGKMNVANTHADNPKMQQMLREEVLSSLSIREEENKLEHRLQHFIDLIEPNPRAMKRLINDISTAKAISFLYKQEVVEDQLILWTILKLQHPLLADFFWNNPAKIDLVIDYADSTKPLTGITDFDQLLANAGVKKLFQYPVSGKMVQLNKEFLSKLKFQEAEISSGI